MSSAERVCTYVDKYRPVLKTCTITVYGFSSPTVSAADRNVRNHALKSSENGHDSRSEVRCELAADFNCDREGDAPGGGVGNCR